jgi:hypothetical protein
MRRNVAGQVIGAQMINATTGAAFTGSVTAYVTSGGAQAIGSVGSGACTHQGNGFHTYAPAQSETNFDHVAFTFVGTGAIPATVQVYPSFPQTGDAFARIGAPVGASISADIAAVPSTVWGANISSYTTDLNLAGTRLFDALQFGDWQAPLTSSQTAAAVWNAATASYGTAGSYGLLVETNIDAAVSTRLASASYTAPPTTAQTATAVWGADLVSNINAGSMGERLLSTFLQADWDARPPLTSAQTASAVWNASTATYGTAGSYGLLVETNLDAAVSSRLATAGYTAPPSSATIAAGVWNFDFGAYTPATGLAGTALLEAMPLSEYTPPPTAIQNADALLTRDMGAVTGEAARSPLNALRFLRNRWSLGGAGGTTLTVTEEDDTTTAWTAVVTPAPGADPISGSDPA